MSVCAGWRIEHLFEQLDEDESGSLDEQELFTLMKMVAAARSVRVPDQDLRNDAKTILRKMSKEVQGKIVLKEFQRYADTYPEKFKDIIRLRNVFQMFYDPATDFIDYEAMTKLVADVKKKKFQSTLDVEELYRRFGDGSEYLTFEMFTEMYHKIEDFSLLNPDEAHHHHHHQQQQQRLTLIPGSGRDGQGRNVALSQAQALAMQLANVRLHEQRAMSQVCHARTHAHTHTGMHTSSSSIKVQLRAAAI